MESKKVGGLKLFYKIPREKLFSPGGIILTALALVIELLDIFMSFFSFLTAYSLDVFLGYIKLGLELVFVLFLKVLLDVPFESAIFPLLIERVPILSDFLPTWLIRMFV
jgi:hypothetical protein